MGCSSSHGREAQGAEGLPSPPVAKVSDKKAQSKIKKSTKKSTLTSPSHSPSKKSTKTRGRSSNSSSSAIDPGVFVTQQKAHLYDKYRHVAKLGSGAFGQVYLCVEKLTGVERAIKSIPKSLFSKSSLNKGWWDEVQLVKSLDHPNIMKLYECIEDDENIYLVMEAYRGGELFDEIIRRHHFTERKAARVVKQVLSGVLFLHNHGIVHRDLKPENLLFESKAENALIKIVDFGLSAHINPKKKFQDRLGTAYYIAPEVIRKRYDEKCDVWSLGVILYILLCGTIPFPPNLRNTPLGYPPFDGRSDKEIFIRVERGKFFFDPEDWDGVSSQAKDLITMMLTYSPQKRPTAEQCLRHPWFAKDKEVVAEPPLKKALYNMHKFRSSQMLAQAALLFMGSKLTTEEETRELTKIFRSLDTNHDGQLDRDELIAGYSKLVQLHNKAEDGTPLAESPMSLAEIEEQVDKIIKAVDFDESGCVEYSEFVTVAMDMKILMSKERLAAAFRLFDQDQSGTIESHELKKLLPGVKDEQWQTIIQDVDKNKDGKIDLDEFVEMMQKLTVEKDRI